MKPLLDLANNDCRWPVTDTKPFLFCGEHKAAPSSYCACHKAMSVTTDQPQRFDSARVADFFGGGRARRATSPMADVRESVDSRVKRSSYATNASWGIPI